MCISVSKTRAMRVIRKEFSWKSKRKKKEHNYLKLFVNPKGVKAKLNFEITLFNKVYKFS